MPPDQKWDPLDDLQPDQLEQVREFEKLIKRANERVNLVSRLSVRDMRQAHTRHSLALAFREFPEGSTVADWGTGGGLPGLLLAIRFPKVRIVLVDSIRKKTDLVRAMAMKLGLKNVDVVQTRAEMWDGRIEFAVSRATAPLNNLWSWTDRVLVSRDDAATDGQWNADLLALKGGDLAPEIEQLQRSESGLQISTTPVSDFMEGPFEDKFVIEVKRDPPSPDPA